MLSSPGNHTRTDAAMSSCALSGTLPTGPCSSIAPGDPMVALHERPAPFLRCSEHATQNMNSSTCHQGQTPSQRGSGTHMCQEAKHGQVSWHPVVPGTQISRRNHCSRSSMSDTHQVWLHKMVPRTPLSGSTMPGMTRVHNSSPYVCSHVGYNSATSRFVTCPRQCARQNHSRSETCPGQCAHKVKCRSEPCPGQCARTEERRLPTCPGQGAQLRNCNCGSCPGQSALQQSTQQHCPAQPSAKDMPSSHSREREASLQQDLAEVKFWCQSIRVKISEIVFQMSHAV